jgi:hypothetical protein
MPEVPRWSICPCNGSAAQRILYSSRQSVDDPGDPTLPERVPARPQSGLAHGGQGELVYLQRYTLSTCTPARKHMSDNVLVAIPEEVSLALLDEGPAIAEEVIQPRGPVLDVALEVLKDGQTFVSLVVALPAVVALLKKLSAWRRSRPNDSQTIDIRVGGFTLTLDAAGDQAALSEAAELIMRHLTREPSSKQLDKERSGPADRGGRHRRQ